MKIEPIKIKKIIIISLLMLVVSLQSIQVHALLLSAEQSGHPGGLLTHQHNSQQLQHPSQKINSFTEHSLSQDATTDNMQHESDCHPAHVLFSLSHELIENSSFKPVQEASRGATALSIIPSPDTPPPKMPS